MFTIYTQANFACPYCVSAAALLDEQRLPYTVVPLERDALMEVATKAGMTTVPIIYKNDYLVGGFNELQARFV